MAFDSDDLALAVDTIGGGSLRIQFYKTTDAEATVLAAGYFSGAAKRGLRAGDLMLVYNPSTGDDYTLVVDSIAANGAAVVAQKSGDKTGVTASGTAVTRSLADWVTRQENNWAQPTLNVSGAFSGSWKTAHRLYSEDTVGGRLSGSHAVETIFRKAVGSGTNGPSNADYALHIETQKADWLNSTVQGEVDGATVVLRQGAVGDAGAFLINAQKVTSGAAPYGLTGLEIASSLVAAGTGAKLREIKATLAGHLENTGDLRADGFGYMTRPNDNGYTIAHGLLVLGYSSAANTGFTTAIRCSATMATADDYFLVTGDEHANGSGRIRGSAGSAAFPTFSTVGEAATGWFLNGTNTFGFSSNGNVRMNLGPNGVRVGTGLSDPGVGALAASASIHAHAATAIPAGGSYAAGLRVSSAPDFGVFFGSGVPTISAAKGSLYLRSDGTTTNNRAYINTDGAAAWTAITTAA